MDEIKPSIYYRIMAWFMRLFFKLLYHPFAWAYDLVSTTVSLGRWNDWVRTSAKLLTGPRVLELGFGPGHLQEHLHAAGKPPFGLDESVQMAHQARRRLARRGYAPRLARGLAQQLPFAAESFHTITATFPTPYIVDPDTLSEIHRVLKPGGRLVILAAAWITGRSLPDRLMRAVFRLTAQTPPENENLEKALEPFAKAGFRVGMRFEELPGSRLMFIIANKQM